MVCPYEFGEPGGVQQQVTGLAAALRDAGHHVEVFAPGRTGQQRDVSTVGRAVAVPVNGSVARMAPQPAAAMRTVRGLQRGRFDVVHLHEPLAPSITLIALLARAAPTVATFHAAGERTPYRWFGLPARRLAERIDVCAAVSSTSAALAEQHLGRSCRVLFNAIAPAATAHDVLPRRGRSVVFIGRHEPRKGLEVLLQALRYLPPDITLLIAGEGPATPRLRRATAGDHRVRWLGRVSEADKQRLLATAGVLCAPSLEGESFGVVLLEAMAAGLPVVASDLEGYRAAVGDGDAALLVAPGDAHGVADALIAALDDPPRADALAAAGVERARTMSMPVLASRYVELYHAASLCRQ